MKKGPTEWEMKNVIMPLMLSGAKMLDRHCPKCGSPLFEKDGRVFCPVCEYREKQKRREMKGVEEKLREKLNELASSLPDNIDELEKHLRAMERIMEVLERYRKLEGEK
ncbi:Sjogren's syndrome/scleroderma autoantigen 1 family protein [Thermococcus sp.]|uniref:Sjogren's syndrome/scleroderma autoantigen 1 family protein n=1 Tax=Thermococcus sp. TaxID=35749 RepID=UPI002615DE96|nr:Sjogren's syndrome/scleroderma autoantigen 1 family protein [Thermococcus sp.]